MSAFARLLSGLSFIVLGFNQIFHFKVVHESILNHFQLLMDSTTGFFHGIYLFFQGLTPLFLVIAFICQILLGIALVFSYKLRFFGRIGLLVWFLWVLLYYPFYLLDHGMQSMIADFFFGFFQCLVILFCITQKKPRIERSIES